MRNLSLNNIQLHDADSGDIWELYIENTEAGDDEYELLISGRARVIHDGTEGAPVNVFDEGAQPDTETGVDVVAEPGETIRQARLRSPNWNAKRSSR